MAPHRPQTTRCAPSCISSQCRNKCCLHFEMFHILLTIYRNRQMMVIIETSYIRTYFETVVSLCLFLSHLNHTGCNRVNFTTDMIQCMVIRHTGNTIQILATIKSTIIKMTFKTLYRSSTKTRLYISISYMNQFGLSSI